MLFKLGQQATGELMHVVYLYGPPGVGTFTVASELTSMTGFKLFHNHLSVNLVSSVFERDSEV